MYKPTVTCSINEKENYTTYLTKQDTWQLSTCQSASHKFAATRQNKSETNFCAQAFFTHLWILCQQSQRKNVAEKAARCWMQCNEMQCKVLNLVELISGHQRTIFVWIFLPKWHYSFSYNAQKGSNWMTFITEHCGYHKIFFCRLLKVILWENYDMEHFILVVCAPFWLLRQSQMKSSPEKFLPATWFSAKKGFSSSWC